MLHETKLVQAVGIERNIQAKTEETLGANLQLVAQLLGVIDGGF